MLATRIRRKKEGRSLISGLRTPHSVTASRDGTLYVESLCSRCKIPGLQDQFQCNHAPQTLSLSHMSSFLSSRVHQITETSNPGVLVITPEGEHAGRYGAGDSDGGKRVEHAKGVAIDETAGLLYVAAMMGNKIEVFELESRRHQLSLGSYGSNPGQLWGPVGIAVSPRGSLIISERMGKRVQEWDPQGRSIAVLGTSSGEGKLSEPRGVCCSQDGLTLVADNVARSHGRIVIYDQCGSFLRAVGPKISGRCPFYGEVEGKMLDATGVAMQDRNHCVVSHRFQAMKARDQVPSEMISEFNITSAQWIRFVGPFPQDHGKSQVLKGCKGLVAGRNGKVAVLDDTRLLFLPQGSSLPLHDLSWSVERVLWIGAMKDERSLLFRLPKDGQSCVLLNTIIGLAS